jgi:DtxR family Mn-dependent transcriptional regulator
MLSQSIEDYIKAIYSLQQNKESVTTNDVAGRMGVSAASATNMVKKLAEMNLAQHVSYKGVRLTDSGIKVALEILRHHRLLELYLHQALGYSWDKVHDEAEHLEHHISEEFEDRINSLLGNPQYDPHGAPIPSRDGFIPAISHDSLAHAEPAFEYIIQRVDDERAEFLRYIGELGLFPNVRFHLIAKEPFKGPLTLMIDNTTKIIGYESAEKLFILRP